MRHLSNEKHEPFSGGDFDDNFYRGIEQLNSSHLIIRCEDVIEIKHTVV